jgi:hypothetical protein
MMMMRMMTAVTNLRVSLHHRLPGIDILSKVMTAPHVHTIVAAAFHSFTMNCVVA